jgi:glycosyltransferase involved in cell wall biosynthesis
MNAGFEVSVITPVYNAEEFLGQSVESAVVLPEVGEVILVEDGSPDDSLAVCRTLASQYRKVRLFRHPDGGNHGAGASRNVGIRVALCPYVAFLDADDFYLTNRFDAARDIFSQDYDVDGVYGAVGTHFWSEEGRRIYESRAHEAGENGGDLTTVRRFVSPERLFFELAPVGTAGHFHTDGVVVRKSFFSRCGLFNEALRQAQDTNLWLRMAAVGRLLPGRIESPVAMRGVHSGNRTHRRARAFRYLVLAMLELICWLARLRIERTKADRALRKWMHLRQLFEERFPEERWSHGERFRTVRKLVSGFQWLRPLMSYRIALSTAMGYYRTKKLCFPHLF